MWQRQSESETGSEAGTASTDIEISTPSTPGNRNIVYRNEGIGPMVVQVGTYDSMMYNSMDVGGNTSGGLNREINNNNLLFHDSIDLEPIDFEHFVDEPDFTNQQRSRSERMFRVEQPRER